MPDDEQNAGTKQGPPNPRTSQGADAPSPPGSPLRQDGGGRPGEPPEADAGATGAGDVVHDDDGTPGASGQDDPQDPDERRDVASAPPPGAHTDAVQLENAESAAHEPSSAPASE